MNRTSVPLRSAVAIDSGGSRSAAHHATLTKGAVAAIVVGNAMEFFDFVSYVYFAFYIGRTFFPSESEFGSLLASTGIFWVGFLTRPVGGVVIGAISDRAGRKPAMMLTIGLITLGTLGLAATPSYASIGIWAQILIVVARLLQGLALGGEVGPSTALLIEGAPPARRGLYSAWQLGGQGLAAAAAGILGVILASTLLPAQMQAFGWRIPFIVGLLVLPVAIYIRTRLPETLEEHERKDSTMGLLKDVFTAHAGVLVLAIMTVMAATVSTYLGTYMTTYAIATLKMPAALSLAVPIFVGVATVLGSLFGGWLSDRYGRKPVMIVPRVLTLLVVYPSFAYLVARHDALTLFGVSGFLAVLTAISGTAGITLIPELMPKAGRATIIAVSYALGVAIFGGSTPWVVTQLLHWTNNPLSPAMYVMVASVISLIATVLLPETRRRER